MQHWLQQLSKLNNANNRLGSKMVNEEEHAHDSNVGENHHHAVGVDIDAGPQQLPGKRKPYNAADYGGANHENYPTQSLSRPNNNHAEPDGVPPFVTVSSPSMLADGVFGGVDLGVDALGQQQQVQKKEKSQMFL